MIGSDQTDYVSSNNASHTLHTQANFSKNKLSDLPEFLFDLPCLSELDLSHNELRHLPFKVWQAPKLHKLNASHNSIECIPTNWPGVLQECTVITSPPPDTPSSTVRYNKTSIVCFNFL